MPVVKFMSPVEYSTLIYYEESACRYLAIQFLSAFV